MEVSDLSSEDKQGQDERNTSLRNEVGFSSGRELARMLSKMEEKVILSKDIILSEYDAPVTTARTSKNPNNQLD